MRSLRPLAAAAVLVLAACSGDDPAPAAEPVVEPPTTTTVPDPVGPAAAAESDATLAQASTEWTVEIDVAADGFDGAPVDATVSWTGDPESTVDGGPFGRFGACSGLRTHVGAYSVLVSGDDAIDAVSVWTADRVVAAGIYDAEVRIERTGQPTISASGTMTVLDGLQQGEFVAFGASGGRVDGSFSCLGTVPPTPLAADADDDVVEAVEVFALLREGESERVLGLAADASSGAECPGVGGATSPVVLRVEGDAALGGLTSFELTGGAVVDARLGAGGETFDFDDVLITLDEQGSSGVFSGRTADGVSVDGAFRCA